MEASVVDLRHKMKEILKALDRNETVTILYHGKEKGRLVPSASSGKKRMKASEHPSFGMWKDRFTKEEVPAFVRSLRKGRFDAF